MFSVMPFQPGKLVVAIAATGLLCGALAASGGPSSSLLTVLPNEVTSSPESFSTYFKALAGRHPNVVAVLARKTNGPEHQVCSGVLISQSWVLTVAQCVEDYQPTEMSIASGNTEIRLAKRTKVVNAIRYPGAGAERAVPTLLQLEQPLNTAPLRVMPLDVPTDKIGAYYRYAIVGWGRLPTAPPGYGGDQTTFTLRTLPLDRCIPGVPANEAKQMAESLICASSMHYGLVPCDGFQGAPLLEFIGPSLAKEVGRKLPDVNIPLGLPIASGLSIGGSCVGPDSREEPVALFLKLWPYRQWLHDVISGNSGPRHGDIPRRNESWIRAADVVETPNLDDFSQPPPPPDVVDDGAMDNEFRFIASIGRYREPGAPPQVRHKCAGVVVSRHFVLTAGHCVEEYQKYPKLLYVRVGSAELNARLSEIVREVGVSSVTMHPNYQHTAHGHYLSDVALLKVADAIPLESACAERIRTVGEIDQLLRHNPLGYIGSWRTTKSHASSGDIRLQRVPVRLYYPSDACVAATTGDYKQLVADKSVVCAGDIRKDSRAGDSGSPLVIADDGPFRVVGIVSWGRQSRDPNLPGVYSFLPAHEKWIKEQIGSDIEAAEVCQ
jgi:secreted trypsin-like serine protease